MFAQDLTCNGMALADCAAPGEEEIDHEYPYASYIDRSLQRKVGLGSTYYGVKISRLKGLEITRGDGNSYAVFNSDQFEMDAKIDGVMKRRIYFDPITGDYIFDGRLGADAVFTDSLYAEQGDIAELTVDRLSTSRRVRKYILSDTSDDNYIRIQDNVIQLVTGTVNSSALLATEDSDVVATENDEAIEAEGAPSGAVQATNRWGQGLYWQKQPMGHTADGYPTDDSNPPQQIYATTEVTDWPVWIYKYTELVKAQYSFVNVNGVYTPQIILGAGDPSGNSKGYIYKTVDNMLLRYVTSEGTNCDIRLANDGYVEIQKLRRAIQMNFSGFESGYFTEILDGGIGVTYAVEFDTNGNPKRIYDGNHECQIIW